MVVTEWWTQAKIQYNGKRLQTTADKIRRSRLLASAYIHMLGEVRILACAEERHSDTTAYTPNRSCENNPRGGENPCHVRRERHVSQALVV